MRSWATIVLLVLTAGCSESEAPKPAAPEPLPALAVVTQDYEVPETGADGMPNVDAGVGGGGRLANVHGCVALIQDYLGPEGEPGSPALLVWPRGTTLGSDENGAVIQAGDTTLRLGDEIEFGIGRDSLSAFSTPNACQGISSTVVISRSEPVEHKAPFTDE